MYDYALHFKIIIIVIKQIATYKKTDFIFRMRDCDLYNNLAKNIV